MKKNKQLEVLKKSFEEGKHSHAYLFYGAGSINKRETALDFASILTGYKEEGLNPDVFLVELKSEETNISINQIREIRKFLAFEPYFRNNKIVIIDTFERMKPEASSALLKILEEPPKKSVLILGVNGFIGNALSERLLESGKYEVYGMDLGSDSIGRLIGRPGFNFVEGDISIHREWIEYHVRKCDIILPLVAIATPIEYTRNPLRVFELDFEENLRIVRYCVKYNKRVIFPSTSEVYGMCDEEEFDEDNSKLILGPIRMQRWIYSCSKQLLDRVWGRGIYVETRTVDVTVRRLRRELNHDGEPDLIRTVRGVGYSIDEASAAGG